MSAEPTAFVFRLCKQVIPLLGPLRDVVTTEEEGVADVLSKPYGRVQTGDACHSPSYIPRACHGALLREALRTYLQTE